LVALVISSFLQVSRASNKSAVQQEWSNCTVSSIRVSDLFDWRNCICAFRSYRHCRASFTTFGLRVV